MINADMRSLKYFMAVTENYSFSNAAEDLYVSQSSLSKAILRLEAELGVKLFDRQHHTVKLTPAGQRLYADMQKLVPEFETALRNVQSFSANKHITCCFMVPPAVYDIREHLNHYSVLHPEIAISTTISYDLWIVLNALQGGSFDFALLHHPVGSPNYLNHLDLAFLCEDPVYAILPLNHPLASKSAISFSDLKDEAFLVRSEHIRSLLKDFCLLYGFHTNILDITSQGSTRESVITSVAFGHGITVFHRSDISMYKLDKVVVRPIDDLPATPLVLASVKNRVLTDYQREFRQYLADCLRRD